MEYNNKIKIGTRGSGLALAQTNLAIEAIKRQAPQLEYEIVVIHTEGDRIQDRPLSEFGDKGAFISALEDALFREEIDLAVHSAKDMPSMLPEGLGIIGALKRENPKDVLVTMQSVKIGEIDKAVIGTSSLRRQAQIKQCFHNIECIPLRGNVNTRLEKLSEGMYDGIILAAAGIKRLKLEDKPEYHYQYLDFDEMIPAGGQGIIAIEGKSDSELVPLIKQISDGKAMMELEIERKILERMNAGCHEPIGVFAQVNQKEITIRMMKEINGRVVKMTGKTSLEHRLEFAEDMVKKFLEDK